MDLRNAFDMIDLSHSLHEEVPTWTGSCGFSYAVKMDYEDGVRVLQYKCHAGVGTHMDAPAHFIPSGEYIGEIPLMRFIVPLVVIDLRAKMHPDLFVQIEDIQKFEKKIGEIPSQAFVIAYTGWGQFWHEAEKYRNEDAKGKMHFPGFHLEAIQYLLSKDIVGVGIDTLSPDGSNMQFPVHIALLGNHGYIIENMTNLHLLPPKGAWGIFFPPKIAKGTESILRAVALIPKKNASNLVG